MDLTQSAILLAFFVIGLFHHGKKSYRQGREDGTNQGIELTLSVLQTKGIITLNEAEEILRKN
jgi:hypothetical protein